MVDWPQVLLSAMYLVPGWFFNLLSLDDDGDDDDDGSAAVGQHILGIDDDPVSSTPHK